VTLAILLLLPAAGFGQTATEYAVKATYMARFTDFIEWPMQALQDDSAGVIVVSIIGKVPFRDILERTFAVLTIKNKNVEVRYISSVEESVGSHILFISLSEKKRIAKIIAFTRDKAILTVSDTEGFARQGVIINFYLEGNKVRFEINPSAVEEAGLKVSSLLLNYARIVVSPKDKQ